MMRQELLNGEDRDAYGFAAASARAYDLALGLAGYEPVLAAMRRTQRHEVFDGIGDRIHVDFWNES